MERQGECLDEERAVDFVDGKLRGEGRDSVEEHLSDCADCRSLVAALMDTAHGAPAATMSDASAAIGDTQTASGGAADEDEELPPGTRIGPFTIERRLGAGGMGVVHLAQDRTLGRPVAIKLLRAEGAAGDLGHSRLLREAQAAARLSHPNVVAVYEVDTYRQRIYVAMEYVAGGTLRQWLAAASRTRAEILATFRAAGAGLRAAHDAGLVHRDFKPDNVLVGADRVRVADFGLARLLADPDAVTAEQETGGAAAPAPATEQDQRLTRTGALLGTPRYMAPEQRRGQAADARSDQYGFCVALFEALTGLHPDDDVDGEAAATLPRWLRRALRRGLRERAAVRYGSMAELLAALSPPRWPRIAALAAAGALLVGLAGWQVMAALERSDARIRTAEQERARLAGEAASARRDADQERGASRLGAFGRESERAAEEGAASIGRRAARLRAALRVPAKPKPRAAAAGGLRRPAALDPPGRTAEEMDRLARDMRDKVEAGAVPVTNDGKLAAARNYFDQASDAFSAGRYAEAAGLFERAYEMLALPQFLFNAGLSWSRAGDCTRAKAYFQRYLAETPDAEDAAQVRDKIATVERDLAAGRCK